MTSHANQEFLLEFEVFSFFFFLIEVWACKLKPSSLIFGSRIFNKNWMSTKWGGTLPNSSLPLPSSFDAVCRKARFFIGFDKFSSLSRSGCFFAGNEVPLNLHASGLWVLLQWFVCFVFFFFSVDLTDWMCWIILQLWLTCRVFLGTWVMKPAEGNFSWCHSACWGRNETRTTLYAVRDLPYAASRMWLLWRCFGALL